MGASRPCTAENACSLFSYVWLRVWPPLPSHPPRPYTYNTLKAKGDYSQNEWAEQLALRIDRLLNPEYFQNAQAVPLKESVAANKSGSLHIYTILLSPTEANRDGAEGVYATIRNDYAKDDDGNPIFDKQFGFILWGTNLKGHLPNGLTGFSSSAQAEEAAFTIYKTVRY